MEATERQIHAVDPPEPKAPKRGLATSFVPITEDGGLRWLPFPGLEEFGSEVSIRHQSCKQYARWRKEMEQLQARGAGKKVQTDIYRAKLPEIYSEVMVTGWRTPVRDDDGVDTGEWIDGVPWGPANTAPEALVYIQKGKGAVLEKRVLQMDVDGGGYLKSTEDNRLNLFAGYPDILDNMIDLSTDSAAFALPDEDAIRGN